MSMYGGVPLTLCCIHLVLCSKCELKVKKACEGEGAAQNIWMMKAAGNGVKDWDMSGISVRLRGADRWTHADAE